MAEERRFDIEVELERCGALKRGHFRLSSGRHSDTYIQCALLLRDPESAVRAGQALAALIEGEVDLVFSPAVGALLIGLTTALALGREMIFAERVDGAMKLRRGFTIEPGSRVLLVEDVVTTGGSVAELTAVVEEAGASVAGLACLVDRGEAAGLIFEPNSLLKLEVRSYEAEECPMCAEGVPLDTPGSRF
jgi:orotate phosphoribosyltransferase